MPKASGNAEQHEGFVGPRIWRCAGEHRVPLVVAERAGRNDVGRSVLATITLGMKMLGSQLEKAHVVSRDSVPLSECRGLGQPHWMFAIEAQAALRAEGPLLKVRRAIESVIGFHVEVIPR